MSVFEKYRPRAYPHQFHIALHIARIAGGIPTDPKVAEGWLKTKLGIDKDDRLREMVAEVMLERGVSADEAVEAVTNNKSLNGFKRLPDGELCIEGRQLKAAIKEAANVRWPKDRWGPSNKGTLAYWPEHVFVQEDVLGLGVRQPSGVNQRFVHTWRGSAIQYEEYVDDVTVRATIATDVEFTDEQWGLLWLTGEQQGLGASRSQGYGRYKVTAWEPLTGKEKR